MAVQCCTAIIPRLATNLFTVFRYFPVFLRLDPATDHNSVIITATALGSLFYTFTLFASLSYLVFPFQTPASFILDMAGAPMWAGSKFIKTNNKGICSPIARALRSIKASALSLIQRLLHSTSPSDPTTGSAVRWVFATSTDPDNIAAAVALIPTITWSPDSDIVSYCRRIRDTFVDCFEIDGRLRPSAEDRAVTCGRALNHLVLAGVPIGHESNTCTVS
jgi:hypothetical protein